MSGKDKEKYEKIYERKGVMTKRGGFEGKYGDDPLLDKKWRAYGHGFEGKRHLGKVKKLKPQSMIDIGAGHNEFISAYRGEIHGNPKKIKERFLGVDIACKYSDVIAPAHELPFGDKSFDLLVSFDCMEHIPEDEVPLAIKEFERVAKRIYLQISLGESATLIDGELLHVCVKSSDWWLEQIQQYFPNAIIKQRDRPNTRWENIVVYSKL